jgi:hypothetical protein
MTFEKLCPVCEWETFVDLHIPINNYTAKVCDDCKSKLQVIKNE